MKKVRSVLIVDDNPGDIMLAEHSLAKSDCFEHVYSASDGEEALELFRDSAASRERFGEQFPPVVILLDINMPRVTGFEFLEEFQRLSEKFDVAEPAIVLMLTSSNDPRDRSRAEAFPMVKEFIEKPPTVADARRIAERFGC